MYSGGTKYGRLFLGIRCGCLPRTMPSPWPWAPYARQPEATLELERADTPTPSTRGRLLRGVLLRCRREPAIKALLAQGIGRALVGFFRRHWWGIGGHWRALVKERHKNVHTHVHNARSGKYTKTYDENEKKTLP